MSAREIPGSNLWDKGIESDSRLGCRVQFEPYDAAGAKLDEGPIEAVLVKNRSGGTLAAGLIVLFNTDQEGPGAACEGAATAASLAMGVVPWCITGTVASLDNFWLIKKGPCKFASDGGNDVAAGAAAITGATGYVSAATGGTDDFAIVGIMTEAIGAVAGTLKKGYADFRF